MTIHFISEGYKFITNEIVTKYSSFPKNYCAILTYINQNLPQ
jgi:hypothetical protein